MEKRKNFTESGEPTITEEFKTAFEQFMSLVSIRRLSQATRMLLLFYIKGEEERNVYIQKYLDDMAHFFVFLDTLEEIYDQSGFFDDK